MTESLLQMDYARAILQTMQDNAALFEPAVELTDGDLRAEIGRYFREYTSGRNRVLVRPEVETPVDGLDFEGSNWSDYGFTILFETKDVLDKDAAVAMIGSAMRGVFGDQGAATWANLTDTGGNLIGSPGLLTQGAPQEQPPQTGPDSLVVAWLLTIRAAAKVPRTHSV